MKRKYKSQMKLPRDREDNFIKDVHDDVTEMLNRFVDLEGDQEDIDYITEGILELQDIIEALVDQTELPKRLKRPWDISKMN